MNKEEARNYLATVRVFDRNLKLIGKEISNDNLEEILRWLHRQDTTLERYNMDLCNRPTTDEEKEKHKKLEEKVVKYIKEKLGFDCYTQRDPRGYAIRILLPDKTFNSWDGETWTLNW